MRLISWNCNMALRRKADSLLACAPDIAVIQECARDDVEALGERGTFVWVGENPKKGLGIIARGDYRVRRHRFYRAQIPVIAPVQVEGPLRFNLLAVWACHHKPHSYDNGLGPLRRALRDYRSFLGAEAAVVTGDFNNHVRWDKPGRLNNHQLAVDDLARLRLASAYHAFHGAGQGGERHPTLYWRDRREDGPTYHIDYCFIPAAWTERLVEVRIGSFAEWVGARLSDHVPLIIDIATG
jgi:exodeoxyribonuclease-3